MYNIGVVWRNRNDFEFKCYCRFCKYAENHFGYADDYFQYGILPSWHCPKCGKNEDGLSTRLKGGLRKLERTGPNASNRSMM